MKSLFPNASLRQLRWPSVQPANVQRRQKLFWVIARVLGSIHHVQNKGSVHVHKPVDGFSWCRNALSFFFFTQTSYLLVGANLKRNFSYLKDKPGSLCPANVEAAFKCALLYFTQAQMVFYRALLDTCRKLQKTSAAVKNPQTQSDSPLFFLYKASFVPAQTSLKSLSPGRTCLWGVVLLYRICVHVC